MAVTGLGKELERLHAITTEAEAMAAHFETQLERLTKNETIESAVFQKGVVRSLGGLARMIGELTQVYNATLARTMINDLSKGSL